MFHTAYLSSRMRHSILFDGLLLPFVLYASVADAASSSALSSATRTSSASHSVLPSSTASSLAVSPTQSSTLVTHPASLVNLFVGTTNGGHVFPGECSRQLKSPSCVTISGFLGATLPHGMVKVGMDTDSPGNVRIYAAPPILEH